MVEGPLKNAQLGPRGLILHLGIRRTSQIMKQTQSLWLAAIFYWSASLAAAQPVRMQQHSNARPFSSTPTLVNSDVWAFGTGVAAGGIGIQRVQWTKRALGAGIGIGIAGVGAQGLMYPLEAVGRFDTWKTYVAGEGLLAPWHIAQFRARSITGFTIGVQRWSVLGSRFFDVGLGMAATHDGRWFGQHRVLTGHLSVGGPWP